MLLQVTFLLLSLVALYYGAELALEAGETIGTILGLSPLVIGLFIVGFGTSLPEFFVSQLSTFRGHSEIALGSVIGSNIANICLVMGLSGLFVTLNVKSKSMKNQLFFHLAMTIVLALLLRREVFDFLSGIILLAVFLGYFFISFKDSKADMADITNVSNEKIKPLLLIKLFIGFSLLYAGGELLVYSGSNIGKEVGVSEYVISAIFVAFGTSFPELVTAIMACLKKKDLDLITGNVIGSNMFNVTFVLMSLMGYQFKLVSSYQNEMLCLLGLSLFLIALNFLKKNFQKLASGLCLGIYGVMVFLWLS